VHVLGEHLEDRNGLLALALLDLHLLRVFHPRVRGEQFLQELLSK
jgi:hypothetical protein